MQPLAAVLRTTTVNDDTFFAAEYAAQAAAERTVDNLYARADQARNVQAAVATAVVVAAGVAISAAWRSQLGRKVRNKIATAIKAE
jgi:hypothetical protein